MAESRCRSHSRAKGAAAATGHPTAPRPRSGGGPRADPRNLLSTLRNDADVIIPRHPICCSLPRASIRQ